MTRDDSKKGPLRRLFLGTMLDPDRASKVLELQVLAAEIEDHYGVKLRFVRGEKLHVTWLFIGEVEAGTVEALTAKLDDLLFLVPPFSVAYDSFGGFPDSANPRLLGYQVSNLTLPLKEFSSMLRRELSVFCVKEPETVFRPHISSIWFPRDADVAGKPEPPCVLRSVQLPLVQNINAVELIESNMGPQSDSYTVIRSWPLKGARGES